jgi:hypothetical protein
MPEGTSPLAAERPLHNGRAAPHTSPTSPADMLQAKLGCNDIELRILQRLIAWGSIARTQVGAITACERRPTNVSRTISGLRRKLAQHKIELGTSYGSGWTLPQDARKKILELLTAPTTAATPKEPPARSAAA